MRDVAPNVTQRRARHEAAFIAVGLFILTVIAYWPVGHFDFVTFDDYQFVVRNPALAHGFSWQAVGWAFHGHCRCSISDPLSWISHALDISFFGFWAGGHHLVSLTLHALTVVLLFLAFLLATGRRGRSALAAALFAIHPLNVESVAWISERKNVLSGVFCGLAIVAYVAYVKRPSWQRYVVILLTLVMGLLAKPVLVTLPITFLLLDYWPLGRWDKVSLAKLVKEKIPLAAVSVVAAMAAFAVTRHAGELVPLAALGLRMRVENAMVSYAVYLGKVLWPASLSVFYRYPDRISVPALVGALALLGLMTVGAWRWRKPAPYLLVGWFWFLGTLVPSIGLVQLGAFARADRFMYVPLMGLLPALVWYAADRLSAGEWAPRVQLALGLAVLVILLPVTRRQVDTWQNGISLWTHALALDPANARASLNLGTSYALAGDVPESIAAYKAALQLDPKQAEAHNDLGLALVQAGQRQEAAHEFEAAVALKPDYAEAHDGLGNLLEESGQTHAAVEQYLEALEVEPDLASAHANLAVAYADQKQTQEATREFATALRLEPGDAQWEMQYGLVLANAGQYAAAQEHLQAALQSDPSLIQARNALLAVTQRQGLH